MLISDIYGKPFVNTFITLLTLIALACSFGNICFWVATWKVRHKLRQKNTYYLLLNFFFAEWLFSMIVLPADITFLIKDGYQISNQTCLYFVNMSWIAISASALSLSYTSLCRMTQICYPKMYNQISKPVCLGIICVSTWIPCILICLVSGRDVVFIPHFLTCVVLGKTFYRWFIGVIYVPATVTISVCYVRVYMYTRQCRRFVEPEDGVMGRVGSQNGDQLKTAKKVVRFYTYCVSEIFIFYLIPGFLSFLCGGDCDASLYAIPGIISFIVTKSRSLASLTLFLSMNLNVRRYLISGLRSVRKWSVSRCSICSFRKKRQVGQGPPPRRGTEITVYVIKPTVITSEDGETVNSPPTRQT